MTRLGLWGSVNKTCLRETREQEEEGHGILKMMRLVVDAWARARVLGLGYAQ